MMVKLILMKIITAKEKILTRKMEVFLAESDNQEVSNKSAEKSAWNPLNIVWVSWGDSEEDKSLQVNLVEDLTHPIAMKGRIILYTKL
ncbi:hypothetical protein F511_40116 [Dorcoceras hygrometricum]|uniref:Uncharacterized protein n=1 Tax=Dorcoceras hygrometricum TaxID=472368 RepID=A0A2Z7AMR9_9LAMI|nr:hypothetical protein F511_40116 [Dorcoceras hygrometricum]